MAELSKDYILSTFRQALKSANADQTEIVLESEKLSLSRFAESKLTQNLTTSDNLVIVRSIRDKKIGVSVSNSIELEDIKKAVKTAEEISAVQEADEQFITLPNSPLAVQTKSYYQTTDTITPGGRADAIDRTIQIGKQKNLTASGAYKTTADRAAVVNSLGTEQYYEGTLAEFSLTMSGDKENSGFAISCNRDSAQIDPDQMANRAADKAVRSIDPIKLETGPYTIIMEPAAVGQMVLLFSFLGFGCKTFISRRSFMSGNIGKPIVGGNITLTEDPYNDQMQGMPFDFEGVPRQQVDLISNGIARGVVWNSYYAGIAQRNSTGHAHPAYKTFSPYPKYMVMEGGKTPLQEMISSVERGVYITHFWYVNYLNPMMTMVTGTTIDGTFLIENGRITKPIVNMRMAQSIQEMLKHCSMVSTERELYPQYSVMMLLPYLKVENFSLTAPEEDK